MASNLPSVCLEKEGGNKELKVEDNKEFEIIFTRKSNYWIFMVLSKP